MRRPRILPLVATLAVLVTALPADACTLCGSDLAGLVRQRLFDGDLWFNCIALVLPFAVFAGAILLALREPPNDGRRSL